MIDDDAFDALLRRMRPEPPPPAVVQVNSSELMPRIPGSVLGWLIATRASFEARGDKLEGVQIHPEDVKKLGEEYRQCARSRY